MELNYFSCLLLFTMLAVLQAWFINGIHGAADGETEVLPNGEEKDGEMILYPLKKELTKKETRRYYYTNQKQFEELITKIKQRFGAALPPNFIPMFEERTVWILREDDKELLTQVFNKMIDEWDIRHEWNSEGDGLFIATFYRDIEFKIYSKWIRKPVIECPKCMASVWGAITYWPVVLWAYGFDWWQLPVFIADVVVVSYLSYYFYKKLS